MKLWYSFLKELQLSSKGFYFYIEILMALIMLVVVLFVIPENFDKRSTEYIYVGLPKPASEAMLGKLLDSDTDGIVESVTIKVKDEELSTDYYESDESKVYLAKSESDLIKLADSKKQPGVAISLDEAGSLHYKYYLQGYESQKLKNLYMVSASKDLASLQEGINGQEVRSMSGDYEVLSDRANTIPALLTFNGSFMGMFIIAAYIFLDKSAGIIKAYAVTASTVWQYLMSKVLVITLTTIITSLIVVIPALGGKPDYPLLLLFLVTTGFFASALGLLVSSFFKSLNQSFNAIFVLIIAMMLPSIAYFIPSWEPFWIRFIPSYPILQGFREIILDNGDASYVLFASLGFFVAGSLLFIWSNHRHKGLLTA
ncbi:MAG: ABC transporter permease [Clostridia bacterium]|nr:ABC transporter permease [Clostridia bacterium]